jgi:hypothetical protein
VGLGNLGSESETCVASCVRLVGVFISFEKNFYRLPFTPPSLVRRIGPSKSGRTGPSRRSATPPPTSGRHPAATAALRRVCRVGDVAAAVPGAGDDHRLYPGHWRVSVPPPILSGVVTHFGECDVLIETRTVTTTANREEQRSYVKQQAVMAIKGIQISSSSIPGVRAHCFPSGLRP